MVQSYFHTKYCSIPEFIVNYTYVSLCDIIFLLLKVYNFVTLDMAADEQSFHLKSAQLVMNIQVWIEML